MTLKTVMSQKVIFHDNFKLMHKFTTSVFVAEGPTLAVSEEGTYFVETNYGTCTSNSFSNKASASCRLLEAALGCFRLLLPVESCFDLL